MFDSIQPMLVVRSYDGRIRKLSLHGPPLRLRCALQPHDAAALPEDVIRRILLFLPRGKDWLAADSCCRGWRAAARVLWETSNDITSSSSNPNERSREYIVALVTTQGRIKARWKTLKGFLDRGVAFRGPARQWALRRLVGEVRPWTLPPAFLTSWEMHDGEWNNSHGMYIGSRLLSVSEILSTLQRWKQITVPQQHNDHDCDVLRIPLFDETRARRQVAMELSLPKATTSMTRNGCYDVGIGHEHRSGRIVMISSTAPWAPHFKVLAESWEAFLTLV